MRSNGIATINKMMKIKNMKNDTLIEYINYKRKGNNLLAILFIAALCG